MRGKTCNRYRARENLQRVPSAGKHATGAKRGKTCNGCQARENMQPVPSEGKHATGAKLGKTCNRCKRGKRSNWCHGKRLRLCSHGTGPKWIRPYPGTDHFCSHGTVPLINVCPHGTGLLLFGTESK